MRLVIQCVADYEDAFRKALGAKRSEEAKKELSAKKRTLQKSENRLAELDLHSIEQPIRAGQWDEMALLAASSPVPIALDEELIGCNTPEKKKELLSFINPQYIILKPSLHGGLYGCGEWIKEAQERQIGWWITSALESNIGLNAIAQWCATFDNPLPQGLGTGGLFTNNIDMPLSIDNGQLIIDNGQ